ncbi:MAG: glycosyltransferase family 39 protein [Propionibacteriaceae bacterium]|jgi:mannosyltransferase|nr:glycosyltransferase family 39 protein [Propionibacteriaceae bacterium]
MADRLGLVSAMRVRWRTDPRWFHLSAAAVAGGCFVGSLWNTWNVPFEGDEAATLAVVRMPTSRILAFTWGETDAVHALFYLVAKIWSSLFGQSEMGLRSLVCLALAATVFVVAQIGRELGRPKAALAAAVVMVFLPRSVWAALLARSYTLAMLLAALTVFMLLVALRRDRTVWWAAWGGVFFVAALMDVYSLLLLPVEVLYAFARRRWRVAAPALAGVAVAVAVTPFAWVMLSQRAAGGAWFANRRRSLEMFAIEPFFVSATEAGVVACVILLGAAAGLAWTALTRGQGGRSAPRRRQADGAFGWLFALVVAPLAVLGLMDVLGFPAFYPHYVPFILPFYALALAFAAAGMMERPLAVTALVAVVALSVPFATYYKEQGSGTHRATGWGPTRDLVTAKAEPGDCVVTSLAGPRVRHPSRGLLVYRADYAELQDLSLVKTSETAGGFYDLRRSVDEAVAGKICPRVWYVAPGDETVDGPLDGEGTALREREQIAIEKRGYKLVEEWPVKSTLVALYKGG